MHIHAVNPLACASIERAIGKMHGKCDTLGDIEFHVKYMAIYASIFGFLSP
ncbi:hypothetical protein TDB9533_02937 [Thalassocella blandensis]|nr:hypothetical protein TDB9533_02937 [Thalassocella blandensis]